MKASSRVNAALIALCLAVAACSSDQAVSTTTVVDATSTGATSTAGTGSTSTTQQTTTSTTSAPGAPVPVLKSTDCGFSAPGLTEGSDLSCATVDTDGATVFVTMIGDVASAAHDDPIIHLPGGPGASSEAYGPILGSLYKDVSSRSGRTVVFIDQRGTGRSIPFLTCDDPSKPAECAAAWTANEIDSTTITTETSADDVASVAAAIGARQINLWGASYGSRLALEVARRHPTLVRSLLIESVDTNATPLNSAAGVDGAIGRIGVACSNDALCASLKVDLPTDITTSMTSLANTPLATAFGPIDASVYGTTLLSLMEANVGESLVPLWVAAVKANDANTAAAVLAQANSEPQISGPFSVAMNAVINCADLAPSDPQAAIDDLRASSPSPLNAIVIDQIEGQHGDATCQQWPHATNGPAEPVVAQTATLIMAGAFDSNTPLENAEYAGANLPNSTLVSFPGYGHFPLHRGDNPCALGIYVQFVNDPTLAIDQQCVAPATFRVDAGAIIDTELATVSLSGVGPSIDLPAKWLNAGLGIKIAGDGTVVAVQSIPGSADEAIRSALAASGVTEPTIGDATGERQGWRQGEGIVNDQLVIATTLAKADGTPVITLVAPADKAAEARALLDRIARSLTAG
jgi:pimeloyl-ACP methyl ester carboxylesterase